MDLQEARKAAPQLQAQGLHRAPPAPYQPSDEDREDTSDLPAGGAEKSLEEARADIQRLKAELSVSRRKIRAGGKLLKRLVKEHNVQLDIDPVTWESVGDRPV